MSGADKLTRRALLAGGLGLAATGILAGGADAQSSSSQDWNPPPGASAGVGAWQGRGVSEGLADSGARWYYTWTPDHPGIATPGGCEFVPMIWGERDLTDDALRRAKASGQVLLGFNEPDTAAQANMSVEAALRAWPRLQQTGLALGAPAVATHGDVPGQWLDRFMAGVRSSGYRVDFIPIHWYLSPALRDAPYSAAIAVEDLRQYLEAVHARYGLPLWLTEFSLITYQNGTHVMPPSVQAEFLAAAASMMATLPYLQRWAWFALPPWPEGPGTALYDANGRITVIGERFRAIS
ncbi:glycosyl hydrolase [Rhodococcus sp. OK302]|uniref:glycosyl hydrolase n=1 Tax=Rhodococcus sp. OK302 TaxID=1882769 RepID=UPI000B94292E|nr:glycosyl hydrolase [Rhodococcus sp. OK302]OYD71102.1 putative glycosyl hydrolase [Rhodococcus sp. OK302]